MARPTESLRYIPGLDGLRAVAVGAVMVYHGGVNVAPGGFLGVDVFFALSGFLITSLLLAEWQRTNRIALGSFWARRARRLLPALVVLVLAITAWAWLRADADLLDRVRRDGFASTFYVSNWVFIATGNSYFDQFTVPSPFRHTWSLAIEEQFYLVFPFVFIVAMKFLRRRRWVALAFGVGALLSMIVMAALTAGGGDPSRAYYGTDARLQTLLVGAMLAVATSGRVVGARIQQAVSVASSVALVLLIVAFVFVTDSASWMYQGGFLLIAVISCAVIAGIALAPTSPVNRVLSVRPLIAIGIISYGLYLWHWPIFMALTPDRVGVSGWPLFALRVLVTGVIAAASYRLVEKPIRHGTLSQLKPGQRWAAVSATALATVAALFLGTAGAQAAAIPGRFGEQAATGFTGSTEGRTTVFLLGDSQAYGLRSQIPDALTPTIAVAGSTQLGCGLFPVTMVAQGKVIKPGPECFYWFNRRESEVATIRPDVGLVFAGSWEQYDTLDGDTTVQAGTAQWHDALVSRYREQLTMLAKHSTSVGIVLNHCHRTPDVGIGPEPSIVNDLGRVALVNDAAREAASTAGIPVAVIDVNAFLCPRGFEAERDGELLRVDGLHFTPAGARMVWEWLAPQITALTQQN